MSQADEVGPVDEAVGYVLKQAATALRSAMDAVLRPLRLTVPQYSCLEVLDQRPGLSSAELARATFVTRQSMNLVLQGLQQRGLLTRPAVAEHGKTRPTQLTDAGRDQLEAAGAAVAAVQRQMLAPLTIDAQRRLRADLAACAAALTAQPDALHRRPATTAEEGSARRLPWRMRTRRVDQPMQDEYFHSAPHDYAVQLSLLSDVDSVRIEATAAAVPEWYEYRAGELTGSSPR